MGPIKINIKTDTSEYGGGEECNTDTSDKAEAVDSEHVKEQSGDSKTRDNDYEYVGDECFYTDKGSGVRYKWCGVSNSWVNKIGRAHV